MDTHKENAHPSRMWRLNTHKQAFGSCYLMTVFEDPGFVLMLPHVFSFRALAISSFPLLLFPLLPSLILPSFPSFPSSLLPSPSSSLLSFPFSTLPHLSLLLPSPLPLSPPFPLFPFLWWRYQETSITVALLADWNSGGDFRCRHNLGRIIEEAY